MSGQIQNAKRGHAMNTFRNLIFVMVQVTIFGANSYLLSQTPPEIPPMSAEEQALAQQLDSVFSELTKGMSEREKDQFYTELNSAMEQEIDKMSKMSDDELNKYIQNAEDELKTMGPWPEQLPQQQLPVEQPSITQPVKPVAPPVKEAPTKVEQPKRDMLPIINDILAHLESFMAKVSKIADMDRYIEKWGQEGTLRHWNKTITWKIFKDKVELLKKTLYTVKSIDPKTQKAKHMIALAENEELCNNLTKLRTNLVKHEPIVSAPTPPRELTKESKAAIKAVIGDCLEAVQLMTVQADLDKIIAQYEPTAQKIKEAQEQAVRQAEAEYARRPKTARPGVMAKPSAAEEAGYYIHGAETRPTTPPAWGAPSLPKDKEGEKMKPSTTQGGVKGGEKGKDKEKTEPGPQKPKEKPQETEASKKLRDFANAISTKMENMEWLMDDLVEENIPSQMQNPSKEFIGQIQNINLKTKEIISELNGSVRRSIGELEASQKGEKIKDFTNIWAEHKDAFKEFLSLF